ncbi:AraC-like DNA-binding protein [Pseudomonas nitritireducens]|uniref:AraC-like DNA-binding protein n=1 Tax=Pseudomonas nitroreducens TaxID=46680 RepID=A0A7W7KNW6_PSENT|nr:AraC family transcriptional regulator [Pseudomonas nitritireducens]MBB4866292.1 AraC-like DNA-binding protein [Pseudomonas nitritireducens]
MNTTQQPAESPTPRTPEQERLIALLAAQAPQEGYNLTALPGVRLLRSNRPLTRTPVLYDPGIVIVCQGRKRGYFGEQVYVYDEQQYLAVAVPVPFTMETDATPEQPLLAIYLHLDFQLAAELMLQLDQLRSPASAPEEAAQSLMSSPLDAPVTQAVLRLLEALGDPLESAILAPGLLRELYFRVLTGAQGSAMRAALAMRGRFGNIARALRHIHSAYAQALDLPQLAAIAGMSAPSFHSHFKAITQTSPMQYVKCIRLHQARLLIARQGMSAQAASLAVGYASASQFNREFKRLFGRSPLAEARRMREHFAVPPAQEAAQFVSSH